MQQKETVSNSRTPEEENRFHGFTVCASADGERTIVSLLLSTMQGDTQSYNSTQF
jgi:hypothetical protein